VKRGEVSHALHSRRYVYGRGFLIYDNVHPVSAKPLMISVLYVDDEVPLLRLTKRYLERGGNFSVDTAESAGEGLEKLRATKYDVIVSDYQMPCVDGIELLKDLRASENITPFIIFTGKGREEVVIQAFENGADFYLQKGGEPKSQYAELEHKIRQAVHLRRDRQALMESEVRFRSLVENASDIIRILDREGRIIFDSPASGRQLGYPAGSTIGRTPFEFVHPDDIDRVKGELARVYQNTNPGIPTMFRIRKQDGSYVWAETIGKNLIGVPGVDGIVINTRIIEERKNAEVALRESGERFRGLVEASPDIIWTVDRQGKFTYISPQCLPLLGYSPDELIGKYIFSLIEPESVNQLQNRFLSHVFEKKGFNVLEIPAYHRDGRPLLIEIRSTEIIDEQGEILGFQGIARDITERKRADEALRKSEERFRLTLDATDDGIWDWDIPSGTTFFSPRWYTMLGYDPGEMRASYATWRSLVHPDDIGAAEDTMRAHLEQGAAGYQIEFRMRTREGDWKWIHSRGSVVTRDTDNKAVRMVGTHTDISERKQAEKALRESEGKYRHISEMITNIAYSCLRTPDGVYAIDWITGAAVQVTGYSTEEIRAMSCWKCLVIEEDMPVFEKNVSNLLPGQSALCELRIRKKDGSVAWLESFAECVADMEDTGYNRIYGGLRDVTERKEADESLKLYAARARAHLDLHRMTDHSQKALLDYTLGASLKVTGSGYAFVGLMSPDEEVIDIHAWSDDVMKDRPANKTTLHIPVSSACIWGECVRSRAPAMINDCSSLDPAHLACPEGHVPITRFLGVPIFEGKVITTVIGVANKKGDYTGDDVDALSTLGNTMWQILERSRVDGALRQANRKLSLLSGITRHDLLNEVAVLLGYLDLAGGEPLTPELKDYIDHLTSSANKIRHQVEFTRQYQDIGVISATWQDIAGVAYAAASSFQMKDVTLTLRCRNVEVFADPLLERVFYNLFENSFRHAGSFKTITITCRIIPDGLSVVFEDDGAGIPDEDRVQLFEKGYGKHTGLGLFLSQEILAITGITIAENGKQGVGARFEMTVPNGSFRFSNAEES
jgi:PAS domain S-box-containing protein